MQPLIFTPSADPGKFSATFTTGDINVLQTAFDADLLAGKNVQLTVFARIAQSMPWAVINTYSSFPVGSNMFSIDIPADVQIMIVTTAMPIDAAVLIA